MGISIRETGMKLAGAGMLTTRPLFVAAQETVPEHAVPITRVDRCIACAVSRAASGEKLPPLYIGVDALEGCCPGGQAWMGYAEMPDDVVHYISCGSRNVRGGAAEYLKASPEITRNSILAAGTIRPRGNYLIIGDCTAYEGNEADVYAIICIGPAENIRNLGALAHFRSTDPFGKVIIPWGPTCATLITYPAGLATHAPEMAAFVGPADPTTNRCFSPDSLILGIPSALARRMAADIDESFLAHRPKVAYPDDRRLLHHHTLSP
jgi:uncharacterized protein (DUF169 family)